MNCRIVMRLALTTASAISLSACATITRGTSQTFYVMSEPAGANVTMSNGGTCTTPCQLKLKRKTEFEATIALDGYKSKTVRVESNMKTGGVVGAAGNIVAGGIIGGVIDGSSGAMKDLEPNPLKVVLAPNSSAEESQVVPAEKPTKAKAAKSEKK